MEVLVGIKVAVNVDVRVTVGVSDTVAVGAVDVGNGPNSACAVIAIAVLVLLEFFCASALLLGTLKVIQSTNSKPMDRTDPLRSCRKNRFSLKFTLVVLLRLDCLTRLGRWLPCSI